MRIVLFVLFCSVSLHDYCNVTVDVTFESVERVSDVIHVANLACPRTVGELSGGVGELIAFLVGEDGYFFLTVF